MEAKSQVKLRVARPTHRLKLIAEMYCRGLNLNILGHFENHDGFDGIMVGTPDAPYHFEFTQEQGQLAPRCPSEDILVVFYFPDSDQWNETTQRMKDSGFTPVQSRNPYWDQNGKTFEDPDGYRVVISRQSWNK